MSLSDSTRAALEAWIRPTLLAAAAADQARQGPVYDWSAATARISVRITEQMLNRIHICQALTALTASDVSALAVTRWAAASSPEARKVRLRCQCATPRVLELIRSGDGDPIVCQACGSAFK
jgi:hypothetical protein